MTSWMVLQKPGSGYRDVEENVTSIPLISLMRRKFQKEIISFVQGQRNRRKVNDGFSE